MSILFLDQSGKLGGAELSLIDVVTPFRDRALVGLFADGPFRTELEQHHIPVQVLTQQQLQIRKESPLWGNLKSLGVIGHLIKQVVQLSGQYDLIYANTQRAFVIGAIASLISRRPVVYHLRDILSTDHFSSSNMRLAVTLANRCAARVITNSVATQAAFIAAGGRPDLTTVIYNGFQPEQYQSSGATRAQLRQELALEGRYVVGSFSRLSPWKGQHILLEALVHCPPEVVAVFVGEALFGEHEYVETLHQKIQTLGLSDRVRFLGFRSDIAALMGACDLIAHTSTAPEPFGRVIVEAMLCDRPVVATAAGGAVELIEPGLTGWLTPPGDVAQLVAVIQACYQQPEATAAIAQRARIMAGQQFHVETMRQQVTALIDQVLHSSPQAKAIPSFSSQ